MLLQLKISKQDVMILLFGLLMFPSFGQQIHPEALLSRAPVLTGVRPDPFFKIPELRSTGGELNVDLYVNEMLYEFEGDTVKLRTYTYQSGGFRSTKIGPWGPTLRIGRNDRLNVTVHNNLEIGEDVNYLGSIPLSKQNLLEEYSNDSLVKAELDTVFAEATNYVDRTKSIYKNDDDAYYKKSLLNFGNLDGAYIDEIKPGEIWMLYGRVPCPCPEGEPKSCTKVFIDYRIEKRYNYGTHEYALRVYEIVKHGENFDHNVPHNFNVTNFHTHGFHVAPSQDDILRTINPSYASLYTYDLVNHTPGTMWYHPHIHGSTALQVGSGMSGMIIIEDDVEDTDASRALAAASTSDHERVIMFNQITFDNTINEAPDFNTLQRSDASNGTTVNGVAVPILDLKRGEVQRWRMLHSGYKSNLALVFPEELEVTQIAVDGILFKKGIKTNAIHMAPGNRCDILIRWKEQKKFPKKQLEIKSATYYPSCEYFENDTLCTKIPKDGDAVIMYVNVKGAMAETMEFPSILPGPGKELATDLSEIGLTHPEYTRKIEFDLRDGKHAVNNQEFDGDTIPQILVLGEIERWEIKADSIIAIDKGGVNHPFHIHINPFQVMTFNGDSLDVPMWKDVVSAGPKNVVTVYTHYEDYVGDFVLHCHILNHEDTGMMQRVRIVKPLVECPIENEIKIKDPKHDRTHGWDVDNNPEKN